MTKCRGVNRGPPGRDQAGRRATMFDGLISLLIVIALVLYILDYIGLIDILSAFVNLIVGAIGLTAKLLLRLYRHLFGANTSKSHV
jgi:hypothetical protein